VNGTVFYLANYSAGFRAIDLSNLAEKEMSETGFFDTYPNDDATDFTGVWNVYPYFKSGVILISDINSGLFLVKASN
jgi:choice-of-anchor B domain-containing protein